jgi:DNA-3-methyladenine glycosylase II
VPRAATPKPVERSLSARHAHLAARDPKLAGLIARVGEVAPTIEPAPVFEALAHSITYQQLNGNAAATILARWTGLVSEKRFPKPAEVLALDDAQLRAAGLSFAKIAAIKDLAQKTVEGALPTSRQLPKLSDEAIVEALTCVRGVGVWTVEMLLMFRLGREDVLPTGDFGVRNGCRLLYDLPEMPTPKELAAIGERWRPHRSLASFYLWRAVDLDREDRQKAAEAPTPPTRARAAGATNAR